MASGCVCCRCMSGPIHMPRAMKVLFESLATRTGELIFKVLERDSHSLRGGGGGLVDVLLSIYGISHNKPH